MPIYEYQCQACGEPTEFLQKHSEAPKTTCPKCGKDKLQKQISAAGFQLKGTGWYVTDFKDKGKKPEAAKKTADTKAETKPKKKTEK